MVKFSPYYYILFITFGYMAPVVLSLVVSIIIYLLAHRASQSAIRRSSTQNSKHPRRQASMLRKKQVR